MGIETVFLMEEIFALVKGIFFELEIETFFAKEEIFALAKEICAKEEIEIFAEANVFSKKKKKEEEIWMYFSDFEHIEVE